MANKKKNRKSKKKIRVIYTVCMIVLLCVFLGCGIYLIRYFWASHKSEQRFDELKNLIIVEDDNQTSDSDKQSNESDKNTDNAIEYIDIDGVLVQKKFSELYSQNHDFIGWLTIDDTVIDYPVMQSMYEEEYYIHRDFDKEYSAAGTLFIDTSSNVSAPSDNILIYGHNMQSGKMFHALLDYEKEDFYKNHKYIQFDTIYGDGSYEVIAAFRTEIYDEEYSGFKYYNFFEATDAAEFESFVANCKKLTSYNIDTTASYGDTLITLSTCAYHTANGRFVVVAKKIN